MPTAADLPLVGGHIALDFVNTTDDQDPAGDDVLQTPTDLRTWGQRSGLLAPTATIDAGATAELARTRSARELLHDLFRATIGGAEPDRGQLAQLSALVAEAHAAATLAANPDGRIEWSWHGEDLASVRHIAVTSGLDLLQAGPDGRLKLCPGENCGWLFLDTSKRGNRRWCSMNECGQKAKDEQRRARRRDRAGR